MAHHHKHADRAHSGPGKGRENAAVASGYVDHNATSVSADDIRLCAYQKWESAGKPIGDGIQFWLDAERELAHGM